jgi:hypothetical protein
MAQGLADAKQISADVPKRWAEIDLDKYKNQNNDAPMDRANIFWLVFEEDDSHDIYDAFSKEINSYALDSLPARVKSEKRKNAPQLAGLKPGWGLYDGKGQVYEYTEEPPSFDLISAMAKRNGIVSMIEECEKFQKLNPKNGSFEADLFRDYLRLANKRMDRFNKSHPVKQGEEKLMLPEEDDLIIWGPSAKLLEDFLESGRYRHALGYEQVEFLDLSVQSPTMRRVATRLIYQLDETIKRDPAQIVNYPIWLCLNDLTGNKHSLLDTLSKLPPVPGESLLFDRRAAPSVIGKIHKDALKSKEWDFIIGNSAHYWNIYLTWWQGGDSPKTDDEILGILGRYIEALLAKNQDAEADRIFEEFMEKIPSGEVQAKLVQIANKNNKAELGKRWQAATFVAK